MREPSSGKHQKNHQDNLNSIGFLSSALEELTDFSHSADIYAFMSRSINQITGNDSVILVNSFDPVTRLVTLRSITGVEPWRDQVETVLGRPLDGLSFIIPRGADIPLQRGGFDELQGGLSTLTFGHIPEDACRKIESLPFFGRIFGTGISWKGQLHGSVVIIRPPSKELERGEVISLFIRQVAGYLRRRSAETEVSEQYATLRGIIDSSDTPIFSLDREYRYTSFNGIHADLMKKIYGADIKVGQNLFDYMTVGEDRIKAKRNIDRALAGEHFTDQEYSGENARTRLFFEISHNPVRDAGGAIIGAAIYARDVSQRRKTELALRESEATAKALIDATTESALLIDEAGKVLAANRIMAKRLGHTIDKIVGHDAYTLIPPDLAESRRKQVQIVTETGRPVQFEDVRFGRTIENNIYPVRDADGKIFRYAIYGRDITRERTALDALQQSEDRLKLALQASNLGIWTWNLQTDERHVFQGQQEIFGYSERELEEYFRNIEMLAHPLDRSGNGEIPQTIRQSDSSDPQEFELRIRDKNGNWKTMLIRGNTISRDPEGKPMLMMGTFRDITKRKLVEEALRESETRYRSFVQSFRGIAYLSASNWTPIFFHGAVEEITGYTETDFISGNPRWDEVILPEDLAGIIARDNNRLLNEPGCCIHREYRIRRKDGKIRWLADLIQNRIDEKGNLVLSGILTDITERKQIEETLRESEKRYRDMFEINNAVMLIIDPATGTITDANAAAIRFYGYSQEEMRGMHISMINTLNKNDIRAVIKHAESRDGAVFHFQHRKKSGEIRDVEVFSAPIVSRGRKLMHSIIQDITDRKRAEEALRLANRKLNLLSGITRHDIRNQLLALSGFLEFSKKTLSDPAATAEFIEKEEKIAKTIANQIIFTKDYEDLGVKAPAWQNVSSIIQQVITRLPTRNISIDSGDSALEIFADPLVEKVFYNLIDNALKYGGVRMTKIRVSTREDAGRMIITVDDDGEGICDDDRKKLFTKGFGKHTGLGLYLSKEILSITDIAITENGEPGKGARFEITVPEGVWRFEKNEP